MSVNVQVFRPSSSSQNWTKPSGTTSDSMTRLRLQAGGGAGGGALEPGSGEVSAGNGGSGGNYCELWIPTNALEQFCTINPGEGGQGVAGEPGGAGDGTFFISDEIEIEVRGGLGGDTQGFSSSSLPRLGTGTPPDLLDGGVIFVGISASDALIVIGGAGGSGHPLRSDFVRGGEGGSSHFAGATRMSQSSGVGRVGNVHGGGGGGAANIAGQTTDRRGGHGQDGIAIIETYI